MLAELKKPELEKLLAPIASALAGEIGGNWSVEFRDDYHYPNAGEYRDGKNSGHSPYINLKLGEGYGEIKAAFYSEGNASVDISLKSLPLETAIKVCQALATIKSNKTNA